jgi:hypothetical protein
LTPEGGDKKTFAMTSRDSYTGGEKSRVLLVIRSTSLMRERGILGPLSLYVSTPGWGAKRLLKWPLVEKSVEDSCGSVREKEFIS